MDTKRIQFNLRGAFGINTTGDRDAELTPEPFSEYFHATSDEAAKQEGQKRLQQIVEQARIRLEKKGDLSKIVILNCDLREVRKVENLNWSETDGGQTLQEYAATL